MWSKMIVPGVKRQKDTATIEVYLAVLNVSVTPYQSPLGQKTSHKGYESLIQSPPHSHAPTPPGSSLIQSSHHLTANQS